jgi:excinuclease ABC subunit C
VATHFHFEHSVPFSPENPVEAEAILRAIPAEPGIFALRGHDASAQPYLTRTADLRRRARRLLAPPDSQSKRLNLRDKVARIDYTVTGSEFESTLTLYHAASALFGYPEARRRLKLTTPFFLRFTAENDYPRVYSTNRLSKRALAHLYGPFPSRAAADRYCDAVLDLFKLRRCYEDLAGGGRPPHPPRLRLPGDA